MTTADLHVRGLEAARQGRPDDALIDLRASIAADPLVADFHSNLAAVLGELGRADESIASLQEAIRLRPDFAAAHNNLGVTFERLGRYEEAVAAFERTLEITPESADAHHHLGNALNKLGRAGEAQDAYQQALKLRPNFAPAWRGLAAIALGSADINAAIYRYRQAVKFDAASHAAHSDLLHAMLYDPQQTREAQLAETRRWAELHARPLYPECPVCENDRHPSRRLRVGYVSFDLRDHPEGRMLVPILEALDRNEFETFCYSDVAKPDRITHRLRELSGHWRATTGMPDQAVADLMRADRIDVLVDLSGHFGNNRMRTFAR